MDAIIGYGSFCRDHLTADIKGYVNHIPCWLEVILETHNKVSSRAIRDRSAGSSNPVAFAWYIAWRITV
jgi:hypothetical protein